MGRSEPAFLVVGHINKAHGTKGELFVWSLTDHPGSTFAPGVMLHLGNPDQDVPDPTRPALNLESVRPFRRGYLVRFRGVQDRTAAEALQGLYVFRPVEELAALQEGELFYHQLLGMKVVTVQGEEVGSIEEVYELRPADLLAVRGRSKLHFIPFLSFLVKEVDTEAGVMVIDPPEGLLEL